VTRQPGPGEDPRLQALTSLAGWRQFAGEAAAVPGLLDTATWQDLDPASGPPMTTTGLPTTPGSWSSRPRRSETS
jgi:hypothetical protein